MINCRVAEADELKSLATIHVEAWKAAYRGMMPDAFLDALDESHGLSRLERVASASPPQIAVAELEDQAVAFCRFGPSQESNVCARTMEVFAFNVAPRHWRSGVGRILMEYVLTEITSRGSQACTLWVLTENNRARRFYEALGFQLDGATRIEAAGTAHPLQEVRYQKTLTA